MNYYAHYDKSGEILYKEETPEYISGEGIVKLTAEEYEALDLVKERLIFELKEQLKATDYIACKIAEGAATPEEYAEVIAQRQAWRDQINLLTGEDT